MHGDYDNYGGYGGWRPYVPVHARRARAAREMAKRMKKGHAVSPVEITGREIATTFWGRSWCKNLEGYSDYSNRLPRGRTYVRNGSVVDLQMRAGEVEATVSGSELYSVKISVSALKAPLWRSLCKDCVGGIDSLVELLRGRFEAGVMERMCRTGTGLFPSPQEIRFKCSCPDWASMCKHVAAVLYGVGARLDHDPELLFRLRKVTAAELVASAASSSPLAKKGPAKGRTLASSDVAGVFGVELEASAPTPATPSAPAKSGRRKTADPKQGGRGRQSLVDPSARRAAGAGAKATSDRTPRQTGSATSPASDVARAREPGQRSPRKRDPAKATAIRASWAQLTPKQRTALVRRMLAAPRLRPRP